MTDSDGDNDSTGNPEVRLESVPVDATWGILAQVAKNRFEDSTDEGYFDIPFDDYLMAIRLSMGLWEYDEETRTCYKTNEMSAQVISAAINRRVAVQAGYSGENEAGQVVGYMTVTLLPVTE